MKCQDLFSQKKEIECCLQQILLETVRVKSILKNWHLRFTEENNLFFFNFIFYHVLWVNNEDSECTCGLVLIFSALFMGCC